MDEEEPPQPPPPLQPPRPHGRGPKITIHHSSFVPMPPAQRPDGQPHVDLPYGQPHVDPPADPNLRTSIIHLRTCMILMCRFWLIDMTEMSLEPLLMRKCL